MQARIFSGRIDLILKKLHMAVQRELNDDKFEPSGEDYDTKKLVEHFECMYQRLLPKLSIELSGFKNIESLDQYFKVLQEELEKLIDTTTKNKKEAPQFEQFCFQHNLSSNAYKYYIRYLSNIVHIHHLFARIKFFLGLLAENETPENYAQAIATLNQAYTEKLKGPISIQDDVVKGEVHVANVICHKGSAKLKEKGYSVGEWKLHLEGLQIASDKRADSIVNGSVFAFCKPTSQDKRMHASALRYLMW